MRVSVRVLCGCLLLYPARRRLQAVTAGFRSSRRGRRGFLSSSRLPISLERASYACEVHQHGTVRASLPARRFSAAHSSRSPTARKTPHPLPRPNRSTRLTAVRAMLALGMHRLTSHRRSALGDVVAASRSPRPSGRTHRAHLSRRARRPGPVKERVRCAWSAHSARTGHGQQADLRPRCALLVVYHQRNRFSQQAVLILGSLSSCNSNPLAYNAAVAPPSENVARSRPRRSPFPHSARIPLDQPPPRYHLPRQTRRYLNKSLSASQQNASVESSRRVRLWPPPPASDWPAGRFWPAYPRGNGRQMNPQCYKGKHCQPAHGHP